MSLAALNWARTTTFGSPIRKAIVYTLADHHNGKTGRCDPSVETIAEEADATSRAVRVNLGWLQRVGAISILRRSGYRSSYVLNLTWTGARVTPERDSGVTPERDSGVAAVRTPERDSGGPRNLTASEPLNQIQPNRKVSINRKGNRILRAVARTHPIPSKQDGRGDGEERDQRPSPSRRLRRHPLPTDWTPGPEERRLAIEAGYKPDEITGKMRNWALSTGATRPDWNATYRLFVSNEPRFRPRQAKPETAQDQIARKWRARGLLDDDGDCIEGKIVS